MDKLPFEIRCMICTLLLDNGQNVLRQLSLVSQAWYQAAAPLLYERLVIFRASSEQLQKDIHEVFQHPLRKQYLRYLCRLDIVGRGENHNNQLFVWSESVGGQDMLDDISDRDRWQRRMLWMAHQDPSAYHYPLVKLIAAVSSLKEIKYASDSPFPEDLLHAIHHFHPACKLNMEDFYLESWQDSSRTLRDMPLITSPCLHSIRCYTRDGSRWNTVVEPGILQIMELAPNLQKVDIRMVPNLYFGDQHMSAFEPPEEASRRVAQLSTLCFSLNTKMTIPRLNQWLQKTDVAYLRNWSVGYIDEPNLARAIGDMALSLERLERLSLNLRPPSHRTREFWRAVGDMMELLPPLKSIYLAGNPNNNFLNKVLARHGGTLHSLKLEDRNIDDIFLSYRRRYEYYSVEQLANFAEKCPALRELHLTIKRRQGLPPETQIYKALGLFPELVNLYIILDCFPVKDDLDSRLAEHLTLYELAAYYGWPVTLESIQEMHGIFINSSIDAQLAKNIFETIVSAQSTRRLQTLYLLPFIDQQPNSFQSEVHTLLQHFMQSWLITRTGCHDSGSFFVEKLPQRLRLFTCNDGNRGSPHAPKGFFQDFFRCLWPNHSFEAEAWFSALLEDTE